MVLCAVLPFVLYLASFLPFFLCVIISVVLSPSVHGVWLLTLFIWVWRKRMPSTHAKEVPATHRLAFVILPPSSVSLSFALSFPPIPIQQPVSLATLTSRLFSASSHSACYSFYGACLHPTRLHLLLVSFRLPSLPAYLHPSYAHPISLPNHLSAARVVRVHVCRRTLARAARHAVRSTRHAVGCCTAREHGADKADGGSQVEICRCELDLGV